MRLLEILSNTVTDCFIVRISTRSLLDKMHAHECSTEDEEIKAQIWNQSLTNREIIFEEFQPM